MERTVERAGVELACREHGAGEPPLVLVHGFTGSSLDWADVVDDLAVRRRVITFDHRGHGDSTNVGDERAYRLGHLVDDLATVLDALDVARCDLLGHSMGGIIAMHFALTHPERLRSLILMDTGARTIGGPSAELLRGAAGMVRAAGMAALLSFAEMYAPTGDEPEAVEARARDRRKLEQMDPAAFAALATELTDGEAIVDRLPALGVPTTVLVGADDELLVPAAHELAEVIRDARLVVIPHAGHSPHLDNRNAWLAAVERHLAEVEASAGI